MNLLSVLHVERACKLKKEIQRLFQPVSDQERGHFDLINMDVVSSAWSGDCFFRSADETVKISTARIDR